MLIFASAVTPTIFQKVERDQRRKLQHYTNTGKTVCVCVCVRVCGVRVCISVCCV